MPRKILIVCTLLCAACSKPSPEVAAADSTTAPAISAIPTLPKFARQAPDSGPPYRVERLQVGAKLVMDPAPGDQINALQPPVIQTANGQRLLFAGSAVTADSSYFVGDVTLTLSQDALPLEGTLTTSYCRKGENLCRSAKRLVVVP
ncbi:hypothetical protein [Gemmatimonas sp.]|uniref:hypothetical protein n=1 Tax=Gemmatimonas sp. TaxID=1962908 RepID=UPI003F6FBB7F